MSCLEEAWEIGAMKSLQVLARWSFQKASVLRTAISILIVAVVACGRVSEPAQDLATSLAFPFAERIGWLHGSCLAIAKPDLVGGTPVALVITGEPQKLQQARIGERTDSPDKCQALIHGRAAVNAKAGTFFYALETGSIGPTDMGFAIVVPPVNPEVVNGLVRVDLDRNGHSEVFSSCATSEGINFAVWTEMAYQGEPLWSAYYYLDYETEPTCP
jgi:hypothetical protein